MPSVFARLGWLVSLLLLTVFAAGTAYLGRLFTLLSLAVPGAAAFDELGDAALGRTGRRLVYATVYTTVGARARARG